MCALQAVLKGRKSGMAQRTFLPIPMYQGTLASRGRTLCSPSPRFVVSAGPLTGYSAVTRTPEL